MSLFGKATSEGAFDEQDVTEVAAEGLEDYSSGNPQEFATGATQQSNFLSYQNPELHTVMQSSEIRSISYEEVTAQAMDASLAQAQDEILSHFQNKLKGLPEDVRASVLSSLDLQSKYKPEFPLYAQIVRSSLS